MSGDEHFSVVFLSASRNSLQRAGVKGEMFLCTGADWAEIAGKRDRTRLKIAYLVKEGQMWQLR